MRLTAGWHFYGSDDLDALQHRRHQRGRDPIIAEAALAGDGQKPRRNQFAQVAARRRARDVGAVSKLGGGQRLAAHKGVEHRCSRSVTHESGHFHQIRRRDHAQPYRRDRNRINRKQFGMDRTVWVRQSRASQQECAAPGGRPDVMLIRALYFEQTNIVAAVVCSLIAAGFLKGIIGVGMPVVALPLLSLFIDIKSAAMLLSMPLIFSNLPQALEGGKTARSLMQLTPVVLGMIPGLFIGVQVLLALDANVARIIAGLVLIGVGGVTLLAPKLRIQSRLVLPAGVAFGFFGGILGGIAAMAGPLVFIFLLAKGLRGKAFTKEASLYLVVSAGLLAVLLTASREFSWLDVSISTAAMLPVALGMYVGQHMRDRIAPETFKKLVLTAVIAAGVDLLRHGFFG